MSTGIGCINGTSALHRPPPIADGFALRGHNVPSRPSRHPWSQPRIIDIPHWRDVIRRFLDRLALSRPTATRQIPIAA